MLKVFKKYSLPIELQRYIMSFLQEKEIYDKVINDLSRGIHRSYIKRDWYSIPHRLFAYDIFKKQFKKYSIVVKLTDRYEINELASYINCPSPSTPLFSCKLCRKYHQVTYLGEKFCPILNNRMN
tara:strand:+ start:228 stop:602 length:375 start_codon:yes stop_codon:yes gene_type:complete